MKQETWDAEKNEYVAKDEVETINQASALWTRPKNEITAEQYVEFYKHVSHDFAEPLAWTHSRVEGRSEYTQLLFIPKEPPFDLWDRERRAGIKLIRQARLHHGRRRAAAAGVPALRQGRDRLQRPARSTCRAKSCRRAAT